MSKEAQDCCACATNAPGEWTNYGTLQPYSNNDGSHLSYQHPNSSHDALHEFQKPLECVSMQDLEIIRPTWDNSVAHQIATLPVCRDNTLADSTLATQNVRIGGQYTSHNVPHAQYAAVARTIDHERAPSANTHITAFKKWLRNHSSDPYPSPLEISRFAAAYQITEQQVRVAFSNLRHRNYADQHNIEISEKWNAPSLRHGSTYGLPPGSFSCPTDAFPVNTEHETTLLPSSVGSTSAPVYSLEFDSPIALPSSSPPICDLNSVLFSNPQKRKGKKRHAVRQSISAVSTSDAFSATATLESAENESDPKFHWTICTATFKNNFSWKRHEEGVHWYTDTVWACRLHRTTILGTNCVFCGETIHDIHHIDEHEIPLCSMDHVFSRKDLLQQHVKQVHLKSTKQVARREFKVPDFWSREAEIMEISVDALWCGFCLLVTERMSHVRRHFSKGANINMWISGGVP